MSSEADRKNILAIRERSGILVSFGDCAVTANVPGMRNRFSVADVLQRGYVENADPAGAENGSGKAGTAGIVLQDVPRLCPTARPVHEFVAVDVFLPGCPPSPVAISYLLTELLAGRIPDMGGRTRFGA